MATRVDTQGVQCSILCDLFVSHRPEDQVLLYHETEYDTYQADVFNVDLDKYPLLAYAGQ